MDAILVDATVTVPEGRVAEFYASYARWLGAEPAGLGAEPEPAWPLDQAKPPRPTGSPRGKRPGSWLWSVDPGWRVATATETDTRLCRFQVPPNASVQGWRCTSSPVAVKLNGGGWHRLYCPEHVRHYGHVLVDGRVWGWVWSPR